MEGTCRAKAALVARHAQRGERLLRKAGGEKHQDGERGTVFAPGVYTARLTVTDAKGARGTATVQIRVNDPSDLGVCLGARSDEFDGTELDHTRWSAIVRETAGGHAVSDGSLKLPTAEGDAEIEVPEINLRG